MGAISSSFFVEINQLEFVKIIFGFVFLGESHSFCLQALGVFSVVGWLIFFLHRTVN